MGRTCSDFGTSGREAGRTMQRLGWEGLGDSVRGARCAMGSRHGRLAETLVGNGRMAKRATRTVPGISLLLSSIVYGRWGTTAMCRSHSSAAKAGTALIGHSARGYRLQGQQAGERQHRKGAQCGPQIHDFRCEKWRTTMPRR